MASNKKRNDRVTITKEQMLKICKFRGVDISQYSACDKVKEKYRVRLNQGELSILKNSYESKDEFSPQEINDSDYNEYLEFKSLMSKEFELYDVNTEGDNYDKTAIILLSDWHVEEDVKRESTLGLNEFNDKIAKDRILKLAENTISAINKSGCKRAVFCLLGDLITSYLREENMQTNTMNPPEATILAQSLIVSFFNAVTTQTNLESIKLYCICGNHGRTTKKIQSSNFNTMSYEFLIYKNIKQTFEFMKLPIDVEIPQSAMALVNIYDYRIMMMHGQQIRYCGGVGGIYPSLLRFFGKTAKTFKIDKILLGHFHQCVSINEAVVNGSIIGYNAFAINNGFAYEKPAQMMLVLDEKLGFTDTIKLFCE